MSHYAGYFISIKLSQLLKKFKEVDFISNFSYPELKDNYFHKTLESYPESKHFWISLNLFASKDKILKYILEIQKYEKSRGYHFNS